MAPKAQAHTQARDALDRVAASLVTLKKQKRALAARDDLMTYIKFTSPDPEDPDNIDLSSYKDARHQRAVAEAVQTFVAGGFPGYEILILVMPPRHGKTQIVSRHLPAWYSGKYPRENIVVASYNDEFAADLGADVRRIVQSPQHKHVWPGHALQRGGTAKDRLQTSEGGLLVFVGLGGSLTGRGAHLLVCDDLVKGSAEAASPAMRNAAWDWFTRVAMTRRMGRKSVILTFTRWHSDDIIGRLTDPENEKYSEEMANRIKIISLPGLAEEDDVLGRKPGEALWPDGPDTFDEAYLKGMRLLDPVGFSSLYQQSPTVQDGVLFRRENIRFYDPSELPDELRYYGASDHAVSSKQRGDPTCMGLVGVDRINRIFVLPELFWRKAPGDVVVEAMLALGGGEHRPLIWWAEKGHISKSLGPFLRKRMDETDTYFNVVEVTPPGDKEQRAQAIAARVAMGHLYLPKGAWWTERAVAEMLGFPNALHDDFVDFLSYIGLGLRVQVAASAPSTPRTEPKFGTLNWIKTQQKRDVRSAIQIRDARYS